MMLGLKCRVIHPIIICIKVRIYWDIGMTETVFAWFQVVIAVIYWMCLMKTWYSLCANWSFLIPSWISALKWKINLCQQKLQVDDCIRNYLKHTSICLSPISQMLVIFLPLAIAASVTSCVLSWSTWSSFPISSIFANTSCCKILRAWFNPSSCLCHSVLALSWDLGTFLMDFLSLLTWEFTSRQGMRALRRQSDILIGK